MISELNFKLVPGAITVGEATDKAAIIGQLSELFASAYGLDSAVIDEALLEREALGSTGFGRGAAIPHARIEGINRPVAAVLKLSTPVEFDAADGMPVDVIFGLLSPRDCGVTHLHALAEISRTVRDETLHSALSDVEGTDALRALLTEVTDRDVA